MPADPQHKRYSYAFARRLIEWSRRLEDGRNRPLSLEGPGRRGRCIRRYKLFPVSDTRPSFLLPFSGSLLCLGDLHISQSSRLVYVVHFDMAMWKPLLQFHARF